MSEAEPVEEMWAQGADGWVHLWRSSPGDGSHNLRGVRVWRSTCGKLRLSAPTDEVCEDQGRCWRCNLAGFKRPSAEAIAECVAGMTRLFDSMAAAAASMQSLAEEFPVRTGTLRGRYQGMTMPPTDHTNKEDEHGPSDQQSTGD